MIGRFVMVWGRRQREIKAIIKRRRRHLEYPQDGGWGGRSRKRRSCVLLSARLSRPPTPYPTTAPPNLAASPTPGLLMAPARHAAVAIFHQEEQQRQPQLPVVRVCARACVHFEPAAKSRERVSPHPCCVRGFVRPPAFVVVVRATAR